MRTLKIGTSVRITTMARVDAVGKIRAVSPGGRSYEVRLPNWLADGVHLDAWVNRDEVSTGYGRAEVCRCVYCRKG